MSRTKNSIKNSKVSLIFVVLKLLLVFWSRKVFIEVLGSEIVGLNSTLMNILGFLNLAELGITAALAAVLYDPLYHKNNEQIKEITAIFGYIFRRIAITISIVGIVLSFFLPLIFAKSNIPIEYVYCGFYVFLLSSIVGYVFNYKQNILEADQKNYVLNAIFSTCQILKLILQIVVLKYFNQGYYVWIFIEFVFIFVNSIYVNKYTNKHYPWLKSVYIKNGFKYIKKYPDITKTIKNIIPHKFGGFVLTQTDNILIFSFVSLSMVTVYNNYFAIITSLTLILTVITNGIISIIGNMVSEGDKSKIYSVFREFMILFFIIASVIQISLTYLMTPFVTIWIGEDYALAPVVVMAITYNFYLAIIRMPVSMFLHGYKQYSDTWAPWTEAIINLFISLIAGYYLGILGVMIGTAVSLSTMVLGWKPYFLFREGLKQKLSLYWQQALLLILAQLLANVIVFLTIYCIPSIKYSANFIQWSINAAIIASISLISMLFFTYLFCRSDLMKLVSRLTTHLVKIK